MELCRLTERISYLPASVSPLSADVGVIRGDKLVWLFDVGNGEAVAETLLHLPGEKAIVLSHFHDDHTGNLKRLSCRELYCGGYTRQKLQAGTEIKAPLIRADGVNLTLFPIPSPHSKGAIGLSVNDEVAFLGDAVYAAPKGGRRVYNLTLLKELISTLKGIKAPRFLLSHRPGLVRPKEEVIAELEALYGRRRPGDAFLVCNETRKDE